MTLALDERIDWFRVITPAGKVTASRARRRQDESCTGKIGFTTWTAAASYAKRRRRRHDDATLEPYHCRHCGMVHAGNSLRHDEPRRPQPVED